MAALTADFGGTRIKLGMVEGERVIRSTMIDAKAERGLAFHLPKVRDAFEAFAREQELKLADCAGVGMAVPCVVTPSGRQILSTPKDKYADAVGMDLNRWSEQALGLPCILCNDANAALMGEWRFGAGGGLRSLVMMTLGTGIGTAAIIDGIPLRGQHGLAGNFGGHFTANLDGRPCICGNIGCTEAEASSWALRASVAQDSLLAKSSLASEPLIDYAAVFSHAQRGDALALELRNYSLRAWAACAVSLIHAYDPEAVIVGGGIMRSADIILPFMQQYVDRHAFTAGRHVAIKAAALKDDAALLGMAALLDEVRGKK